MSSQIDQPTYAIGTSGGADLPTVGFERAHELGGTEHEERGDGDPGDSERGVEDIGLDECDAGEGGPQAGEQVTEVLADGDAEVAVQGLERDFDCGLGGPIGGGIGGGAGEVGHRERPADQAEELDGGGEHSERGGERHDGRVGVSDRVREEDDGRGEQHGGHGEAPPGQDEAAAALGEPTQDVLGRLAQDVGVVERSGENGEEDVVRDRQDEQEQAGRDLGRHGSGRPCELTEGRSGGSSRCASSTWASRATMVGCSARHHAHVAWRLDGVGRAVGVMRRGCARP